MDKRDKQVKVMLTGAELVELGKKAGHEPLSSYCRRLLVEGIGVPFDLVDADTGVTVASGTGLVNEETFKPQAAVKRECLNCRAMVSRRADGKLVNENGSLHVCGEAAFQ
jgi:hypothetical protein